MKIGRREFIAGISHAAAMGSALATTISTTLAQSPVSEKAVSTTLPKGGTSQFVQTNGIRLHYVSAGSGSAVILLHGWPQTWFAWRETMERLSPHFTIIAPDLRGIGLSERTPSGYDKRTIATDIRDLVSHVAGGRAHIVAHDMGGKAAYMLANLYPDCIEKLILVDA
jgi:pimeloyl-ACP methyl ester carboxylesterase